MRENSVSPSNPRDRARELLWQLGRNTLSFQILQPQFSLWFTGRRACVGYLDTGKAWIAAGPPVAEQAEVLDVALQFTRAATKAGRRSAFFGVESPLANCTSMGAVRVGHQIVVNPTQWIATAPRRSRLREQLRRARNKGLSIEAVAMTELANPKSPAGRDVEMLIERWQRRNAMPMMGFVAQIKPLLLERGRQFYVARVADECVAFAALDPVFGRCGWVMQNLVRAPRAPNGTSESLIDFAIRESAALGSTYFSLGMTPLAGEVSPWLSLAKRWGAPLYNFSGLERFRAKFSSEDGAPIYLAYPKAQSPLFAVYDSLVAFAHGSLVGFGAKVLAHRIAPSAAELESKPAPRFERTAIVG